MQIQAFAKLTWLLVDLLENLAHRPKAAAK